MAMSRLLDDPYLKPFENAIRGRSENAFRRAEELTCGKKLSEWASAHEYYGLHKTNGGWVFRERAPNATSMWLVGDFSEWKTSPNFELFRIPGTNVWEREFPPCAVRHGDNYRLEIRWEGGHGERIPAYARYVVQDPSTHLFCAQVYDPPKKYKWINPSPRRTGSFRPFIYEAHIGMSSEERKVSSYTEFRDCILPRIKKAGYNVVQLMAIMEHPYYGSFGYHVSSFFAASSRFGTPDELKSLIDTAHGLGLLVIMDIVHSHSVKNERDGLSCFDGTEWQYFHSGAKGWHRAWDSRCFDYGKTDVLHFLLSNCRFWLDEYHFDGYRFDGVTSMLFWDHGLGDSFTNYGMYFNGSVDDDAWCYLQMANRVVHEVNPAAITIAEDVSGMPGCAAAIKDYGIGFDYRMAMGVPDFWFRLADTVRDDDWPMGGIYYELTNKRTEEKVVSYVESHDQALVGGKTFFFTLTDAAIYWGMRKGQNGLEIERAIALHKMARIATAALSGGAYLNFMGNEFGHPEWIDFPRQENGWDYSHARRQWSLRDDDSLRFKALADFDEVMVAALASDRKMSRPIRLVANDGDKTLAFIRGDLMFVFNFNPVSSFTDYGIIVPPATRWRHIFDSDEERFGGQGRIASGMTYDPEIVKSGGELIQQIKLYIPSRTVTVLRHMRHK